MWNDIIFYRVNDVFQMTMYRKTQISILSKLTDYKLTKFNPSELKPRK